MDRLIGRHARSTPYARLPYDLLRAKEAGCSKFGCALSSQLRTTVHCGHAASQQQQQQQQQWSAHQH